MFSSSGTTPNKDFFRKKSSSNVAKDRLKMVLVSDRANCSPEIMEQIKNDLIYVLSKYVEIDLRRTISGRRRLTTSSIVPISFASNRPIMRSASLTAWLMLLRGIAV